MSWIVSGCAGTIPAEKNWHALVISHDADGNPIETSPGQASIRAVDVVTWAIAMAIRPVPQEGPTAPPTMPAPTQQQVALIPMDGANGRLDLRKGYLGLSPPNETAEAALARLVPKAAKPTEINATGEPAPEGP